MWPISVHFLYFISIIIGSSLKLFQNCVLLILFDQNILHVIHSHLSVHEYMSLSLMVLNTNHDSLQQNKVGFTYAFNVLGLVHFEICKLIPNLAWETTCCSLSLWIDFARYIIAGVLLGILVLLQLLSEKVD